MSRSDVFVLIRVPSFNNYRYLNKIAAQAAIFSPFHSSILHSLHVLFSFFFPILLLLLLSTPYLTRNPPSSTSISFYPLGPTLTPIPSSSLSPCFTNYHFSLLSISFVLRRPSLSCSRRFNFHVVLLLLLAGDVQSNPGPVVTSSSLNFSCLNIRSASSISTDLDKPAVLQEFLSDHSIDILALTETWLTPETLPSTLNSLTPPGYSIIHSPTPQGKGGGLGLIFHSYLKVSTVSLPFLSSFEFLCVRLTIASTSFTLLVILSSTVRRAQTSLFFKLNFLLFLKILFTLLLNSSPL